MICDSLDIRPKKTTIAGSSRVSQPSSVQNTPIVNDKNITIPPLDRRYITPHSAVYNYIRDAACVIIDWRHAALIKANKVPHGIT
jgi:hypothetical protein